MSIIFIVFIRLNTALSSLKRNDPDATVSILQSIFILTYICTVIGNQAVNE